MPLQMLIVGYHTHTNRANSRNILLAFYWDSVYGRFVCFVFWLTELVVPGANGRSEASLPAEQRVTTSKVSATHNADV